MTTINDIGDLVRILREQPEWAEAVRSVLLSRELLALPEEFAAFVKLTNANFEAVNKRLDQLESDMAEVKADIRAIYGRLDTIEGRLDTIDGRLDTIDGRLDNGFGTNYEMKVQKNIHSYAGQQLGLRSARVLLGILTGRDQELADLAEQAAENGVITWEQNDDLWLSDLIFTGRDRTTGAVLHIAAEVSITAGSQDVARAAERARVLGLIIGQPVTPAVIAANLDEQRIRLAGENSVAVIQVPE